MKKFHKKVYRKINGIFTFQRPFFSNLFILLVPIMLQLQINMHAQEKNIHFHRLSIEEGLSQSSVFCIIQDQKGFMWFGTEAGLNRYDGYDFKVYIPKPNDSTSLSNNWINCIFEDHFGTLWIGTDNGLNKFNKEKETFSRYKFSPDDSNSLSNNRIFSIFEDQSGTLWIGTEGGLNKFNREKETFSRYQFNPEDPHSLSHNFVRSIYESSIEPRTLWIGTDGGGLNKFDIEKEKFVHYKNNPNNLHSLSGNHVLSIFEDSTGVLWVGTQNGGLNQFDCGKEQFINYRYKSNDPGSLSDNYVNVIFEDRSGALWIGTNDGGLNRFNRKTKTFMRYINDPLDPHSLSSNRVFSLFEDRSDVLWIGTYTGGINKFNRGAEKFIHYRSYRTDPPSLSHNFIRSFYKDRSGVVWVGTDGGGLNRLDPKTEKYTHYRFNPNNPSSQSSDRIFSIKEDRQGILWIGTYGGGLNRFDPDKERFTHYRHDPADPDSLSDDRIRPICQDETGIYWIGTDGGGLNRFDQATGKFTRYQNDPSNPRSLSNNRIWALLKSHSGALWLGTFGGGLNMLDEEKGEFIHYRANPADPNFIQNDYIIALFEDQTGMIWIGSNGGGLERFDPEKETFSNFTESDGLASNVVYGILEDDEGHLWISTTNGLSRFNLTTEEFKTYDISDGLQSNEFNGGCFYKSRDGELFFGGINGFNRFQPSLIKENPIVPPIVLTDFKIFNKPVPVEGGENEQSILSRSITETAEMKLSYKDNVISFEFAALHYVFPEKNEYAYKMEGFDKDWLYTSASQRIASYTNLDPGEYIFRVKASNNDGLWNEEGVSLKIKITPPFWQALWFRGSAIIAFLLLIVTVYHVRTRAIRERSQLFERCVEERTEELKAVNAELNDFAYIVSHDLKAPLRAISQLASWISQDYAHTFDKDGKKQIDILLGRVKRMDNLIDGILQYSRAGRSNEKEEEIDFNGAVREAIESIAPPDNIKVTIEDKLPAVLADRTRIGQVFQNLIGNAVKYIDKPEGEIKIGCADEGAHWKFSVADNGPGIDEKDYDKIFQIFQTLESRDKRESTGVGLSVVKKIIELYGGRIWLESKIDEGSTFYFTLKKEKERK